jgi:hypothetical protein
MDFWPFVCDGLNCARFVSELFKYVKWFKVLPKGLDLRKSFTFEGGYESTF